MAMTVDRFTEIMTDKNLTIGVKRNNDNCSVLTINPLHLDEICGSAVDNGFDFFYDTQAIQNHDMELDIFPASKKLTTEQHVAWSQYLIKRDRDNGEQYSWFGITCNDYDHKDGLEKILKREPFSMEVEEYQNYIS